MTISVYMTTCGKYRDCWPPFFAQWYRYFPFNWPQYVVTDEPCQRATWTDLVFPKEMRFSTAYLHGLEQIHDEFVLAVQDDFFLMGPANLPLEKTLSESGLKDGKVDCVRLIWSGTLLPYSMQASIWRTESLRMLYRAMPECDPWGAESIGYTLAADLGIKTAIPNNVRGQQRGNHFDSTILPYIATAIVKGKWNLSQYPELSAILQEHGIDPSVRGIA